MVETWQEELLRDGKLRRQDPEGVYGSALSDRDYALEMLADGKAGAGALMRALLAAANPRLRQLLLTQLNTCVQEHFQMADLAAARGWYQPYASPCQQLAADVSRHIAADAARYAIGNAGAAGPGRGFENPSMKERR